MHIWDIVSRNCGRSFRSRNIRTKNLPTSISYTQQSDTSPAWRRRSLNTSERSIGWPGVKSKIKTTWTGSGNSFQRVRWTVYRLHLWTQLCTWVQPVDQMVTHLQTRHHHQWWTSPLIVRDSHLRPLLPCGQFLRSANRNSTDCLFISDSSFQKQNFVTRRWHSFQCGSSVIKGNKKTVEKRKNGCSHQCNYNVPVKHDANICPSFSRHSLIVDETSSKILILKSRQEQYLFEMIYFFFFFFVHRHIDRTFSIHVLFPSLLCCSSCVESFFPSHTEIS